MSLCIDHTNGGGIEAVVEAVVNCHLLHIFLKNYPYPRRGGRGEFRGTYKYKKEEHFEHV